MGAARGGARPHRAPQRSGAPSSGRGGGGRRRAGEPWWLTPEEEAEREAAAEELQVEDPWAEAILAYLANPKPTELLTTAYLAENVLSIDRAHVNEAVGGASGGSLRPLGYRNLQTRVGLNSRRVRSWTRGDSEMTRFDSPESPPPLRGPTWRINARAPPSHHPQILKVLI